MANGHDRYEEGSGGGSFVMGLLTGTVLGAGLGMLFAPKPGSELRGQLSEQAGKVASTASDGYRRATETAGAWAEKGREKGREVYDKARDAASRGKEEAERYAREASDTISEATGSNSGTSHSTGTSSGMGGGIRQA